MGSIAQHSVSGAVGALVAVVALSASREDRPPPRSGNPVVPGEVGEEHLTRELRAFEARLSRLERRSAPVPAELRESDEVVRVQAPETAGTPARLAKLELQMAEFERGLALAEWWTASEDPGEAERFFNFALSQLGGSAASTRLAIMARIPMRLRFLEEWPHHERARDHLGRLVDDLRESFQTQRAMAAIDRYGPQIGLTEWEHDCLRLQAKYNDDAEAIAIARRIVHSAADADHRAWAMQQLAVSLGRLGRRDEGLATVDLLLQQFPERVAARERDTLRRRVAEGK